MITILSTKLVICVGEAVFVGADSSLELSSSVRGRYLRLVIIETNDVTPSIKPITLTR